MVIWHRLMRGRSLSAPPPRLLIIAEGKPSYDLEYQLPMEAPDPQHHSQASRSDYFLAGRGIGVTPTCSSAVYGAP
jgi:hypothetical protein